MIISMFWEEDSDGSVEDGVRRGATDYLHKSTSADALKQRCGHGDVCPSPKIPLCCISKLF